jgi:peptidyl-prolyl cis-trans isomerase D
MLEFFRSHQRFMQFLLLLVIVPSFIFFGIEGYTRFGGTDQALVEIDGQQITQAEFDRELGETEEQMRRVMGERADAELQAYKPILLNAMIDERVVANELRRLKLTLSDQALKAYMMKLPIVMQLRKSDGSFDEEEYKKLLAQNGLTPEQYQERVRLALMRERFVNIIRTSGFVARSQAESLAEMVSQERQVQEMLLTPAKFMQDLNPTQADLKAYYEAHKATFSLPEQVAIEYLVLSADDLVKTIEVNDVMLKQAYEARLSQYQEPEQRQASHILFAVTKSNTPQERKAIREKAEKTLEILRAHPERFAELAKQESNDPGSAAQGGDLGFFAKGMMVKPFEDAVFKLKEGGLSEIVESDFGFHIIKLTSIRPVKTQSFAEVKDKLAENLKYELALKRYNELAEEFSNLVFDQYGSLKPAADKFKLPILSAAQITRQPNPALGKDNLLNSPKLLTAIFSDDAIKNKRNTDAIQLKPNTLVAARVVSYQAAALQPFEQVQQQVRERWAADKALALSKQEGKKMLAEPSRLAFVSESRWLSRANVLDVSPDAVSAIFRANEKTLPAIVGVDLGEKGYAIYRITQVRKPETVDHANIQGLIDALANASGEVDYQSYIKALREKIKIKFHQKDKFSPANA